MIEVGQPEIEATVTELKGNIVRVKWFSGFLNMQQWIGYNQIVAVEGEEIIQKKPKSKSSDSKSKSRSETPPKKN